jgi:5-methylcytosine-specific restriction endonuclease McrA
MKSRCGTTSGYAAHRKKGTPYCDDCREANRIARRNYYKNNPGKVYEINRRWAAKNPEKVKEYSRRIFAKRKAQKLLSKTEKYTEAQVLELYGSKCHICQEEIDLQANRSSNMQDWQRGLHIDHLIPLSKNGDDTIENVRPAHALCNMLKRNKVQS